MWFKNLQLHRLPVPWSMTPEDFADQLRSRLFQPCGGLNRESRGWIPPRGDDQLVYTAHGQWLIALGVEQKLLPASVVNQEAKARAADIEARMGVKPGRKRMKELKDEITDELLPRAFSRYFTTFVWVDPVNGWLVIDAASPNKGEAVMEVLKQALDEFPFAKLDTERSPGSAMSEWLGTQEAPHGFSIDRDCVLQSPLEERATVRYTHHPLDTPEVGKHLADGKVPTRLALTWQDRVSFELTDQMEVKKVAFLDIARGEQGEDPDNEDERFESDFVLMAGLLSKFLADLMEALGGEKKSPS